MTAVTPTDRPKSVRNSCVITVFGGVFMLSRCFLDCSVGIGVFVTGLSQISSFFSSVVCSMPVVSGHGRLHVVMYYYSATDGECRPFNYGGCDGNANRFATLDACRRKCGSEYKYIL